ncbi:MAG TPA: type II toxin-antitoxin system death-on-curing family toxin [Candidatus Acidoferrales bacterium]|nr:type II toxin-antitoxin system death-on-curing family toxin [Candidatus Acidoferrales bacterium]
MAGRLYPTLAEAIEIHRQLIELFGGSHGFLDKARLEAALFRPQIGYYNDLPEEAAALMESLANNHAFVDGNKRLAFALTDVFLRLNGFFLEVKGQAANEFIRSSMKRGEFRFDAIRGWISMNMQPLRSQGSSS